MTISIGSPVLFFAEFFMHTLLKNLTQAISQAAPVDALDFHIGNHRCGLLPSASLNALRELPSDIKDGFHFAHDCVTWMPDDLDPTHLNQELSDLGRGLHSVLKFSGWRNESLDVFDLDTGLVFARAERGLFRFFGMRTQAVYAVGVATDKRIWSGQRALTKSVDPGLWDTLAAGLVSAGENAQTSLLRELGEEAGLSENDIAAFGPWIDFTVTRPVKEGWMHEYAQARLCRIDDNAKIACQDGEVAQFALFTYEELLEKIQTRQIPDDTAVAFLKTITL